MRGAAGQTQHAHYAFILCTLRKERVVQSVGARRLELNAGSNGIFSLDHSVQTGSGAHQASCPMGTGDLSRRRGRGAKLTTHLHLVPRLRKRGAIPPLPQYVFMTWCLV